MFSIPAAIGRRNVGSFFVLLTLALVLSGCGGSSGGNGGTNNAANNTTTYRSVINGAVATAIVTLEPLVTHTVMSGEIQSGAFRYTFRADLVGSSGYGTLTQVNGPRTSIFIDLTNTGFDLTNNVLPDPGPPTTYVFTKI